MNCPRGFWMPSTKKSFIENHWHWQLNRITYWSESQFFKSFLFKSLFYMEIEYHMCGKYGNITFENRHFMPFMSLEIWKIFLFTKNNKVFSCATYLMRYQSFRGAISSSKFQNKYSSFRKCISCEIQTLCLKFFRNS